MSTISILGIDIAKNTFQLYGADHTGKAVVRKRQLAAYVANLARYPSISAITTSAVHDLGGKAALPTRRSNTMPSISTSIAGKGIRS